MDDVDVLTAPFQMFCVFSSLSPRALFLLRKPYNQHLLLAVTSSCERESARARSFSHMFACIFSYDERRIKTKNGTWYSWLTEKNKTKTHENNIPNECLLHFHFCLIYFFFCFSHAKSDKNTIDKSKYRINWNRLFEGDVHTIGGCNEFYI